MMWVLMHCIWSSRRTSLCTAYVRCTTSWARMSCPSCGAPLAHLDVGLAERRTPCRFVGNLTFPSLFLREDGIASWCTAFDPVGERHYALHMCAVKNVMMHYIWCRTSFCTAFDVALHHMQCIMAFLHIRCSASWRSLTQLHNNCSVLQCVAVCFGA